MDARFSDSLGFGGLLHATPRSRPAGRDAGPLTVEVRRPGEMRDAVEAWRRLARRALEPSVFLDPDYLLAALHHLAEGRTVVLVCVWQGAPLRGALRGLLPIVVSRLPFAARHVRFWPPPMAGAEAPLVDGEGAPVVIEAVLAALAERGAASLTLPGLPAQGPFAAALRDVLRGTQRRFDEAGPAPTSSSSPLDEPGPEHLAEADRLRRSLSRWGEVRLDRAQDPGPVRDAVEEFLALEASARPDSALIQNVGAATFLRTATRELARRRRCRVDLLRLGRRPVAAAIFLKSAGRTWLWRAAQDQAFVEGMPAALLALDAARGRPAVLRRGLGDALGWRAHPTARGLWPEPSDHTDLRIALAPPGGARRWARSLSTLTHDTYTGLVQRWAHPV